MGVPFKPSPNSKRPVRQTGTRFRAKGAARAALRRRSRVGAGRAASLAESKLDDALGRLRLLSAHIQGIIFELDQSARLVRIWTSDPRLLARPQSELLGRTIVEALGPELGQRHHDAALLTVRHGTAARYEYELQVPSGRRHFACESAPVPAPSGRGRHAVFWIRDTTEQVQMQSDLLEAERRAWLGTLAAGVAHEINNPLAYMLLNIEQLRSALSRWQAAEQQEIHPLPALLARAEMIHEGMRRVQRIVGDLLQLSRPDAPLGRVDVEQAVSEALELVKGKTVGCVDVSVRCRGVPPVRAHPGRLVQVFTNLLENAVEALPRRREEVAEAHPPIQVTAQREQDRVVVRFFDSGSGLDSATASKVFEPFFTTKPEGTGLGLSICQRLVASFGGDIRAEANEPHGALLSVTLAVFVEGKC